MPEALSHPTRIVYPADKPSNCVPRYIPTEGLQVRNPRVDKSWSQVFRLCHDDLWIGPTMLNLVLQADRRFVTRRDDENTGDPDLPESLGRAQSIFATWARP